MISVTSKFTINRAALAQLDVAAAIALEQTAEALHTDVVQAQVIPRDTGALQGEKTHIKAGETITKDYKENGKVVGTATNTITKINGNKVSIITSDPQAQKLYFNPDGLKFHRQAWESVETVTGKNGKLRKKTVKHDGNPNARDHWFEPWLPGGEKEDFCAERFKVLYCRIARKTGVLK